MYRSYERIVQLNPFNVPHKQHYYRPGRDQKVHLPTSVVNYKQYCTTKWLAYMAYHKQNRRYYFTDRNENLLKTLDHDLNPEIEEVNNGDSVELKCVFGRNPGKKLKRPVAICINSAGHIVIGDHGNPHEKKSPAVYIFDADLECIGRIVHENIVSPSCMEIEKVGKNKYKLYITDWRCNNFTVWSLAYDEENNVYDFRYDGEAKVIGPSTIRVAEKFIAVVSEVSWNWVDDENKCPEDIGTKDRAVKRITAGLNAIVIFDKQTLEEDRIIELIDWLNPRGLYIDRNLNIYTTAYKSAKRHNAKIRSPFAELKKDYFAIKQDDTERQTKQETLISQFHNQRFDNRDFSRNMYLIVMNLEGQILQDTYLGIEFIGDFLVFDDPEKNEHKILFMSQRDEPALHMMEFDENEN